jgi:hypothetical protein
VAPFDVDDLRRRGFEGFLPVGQIQGPAHEELPPASGVYVVVRTDKVPPAFLDKSGAGWWKKKDPTVSLERLQRNWVDGAETLYIGKANCLCERVGLLLDFGGGQDVMHYGGRLLWQGERYEELQVAWREEDCFAGLETRLIDEFLEHFGRLPFANLKRGDRVVCRRIEAP